MVLAATHDGAVGEVFNITLGKAHTLLEFVEHLKRHFPSLDYVVQERDAATPKRGTLSIEKARRLIGYEPAFPLGKGIDAYVEFQKKYHPQLNRLADGAA
jgi:nucleoside-diphosphate-sugar epimerase